MRGLHHIVIQNNRLHYELTIRRNITIIQGDSATGKTTLIDMLRQNMNLGPDSGIDVISDVPCRVLEGRDWQIILQTISASIIFIDEGNRFITSEDFAAAVKGSDNYFVIITRENLYNLPYSVEEIYGLHASGKYQNTQRVYQQTYRIYPSQHQLPLKPKKIIVEDSNSGYDFFSAICATKKISCVSAAGKSNIFPLLKQGISDETCVIADGAAIGAEMSALYKLTQRTPKLKLYLPESFEWLILHSGLLNDKDITAALARPEDYADSAKYFSWEQFFTHLLISKTADTYLQYRKSNLNPVYLHDKIKAAILKTIEKAISFS